MPTLKRISHPANQPLSPEEAKQHLAIVSQEHDTRVSALIDAAADFFENQTGKSLITQAWVMQFDGFPCQFRLVRPPVQSITEVRYFDLAESEWKVLDESAYRLKHGEEQIAVVPSRGEVWPTSDQVEVEYVTGFGDTEASIPPSIKQCLLLLIGQWDEYREGVAPFTRGLLEMPHAIQRIIQQERCGALMAGAGLS